MSHSLDVFAVSSDFRDGLEPRAGWPSRFPHLEGARKFDPFRVVLPIALDAPHQEPPGGGSEIADRLRDGGQIGAQRRHPVEIIKADNRHVTRDFEAEPARGLDRGQGANVGKGENRGRPIGAVEFEFDRAAQALEIMAAVDDAIAPLETGLVERAAASADALLDIVETLRMGENGNVAVSEGDEVARRPMAAGEAIGAHRVESGRLGPPVDQHRWREAGTVPAAFERRHRLVAYGNHDQPVDAAGDERFDAAPLVRSVLAGGDDEKIIAVAFSEGFDPVHEAGEEDIGDVGDDHADETGGPAAKGAGCRIEPIVERLDRFEDLGAAHFTDRSDTVDDVGGGRDRNPRAERDVANGGRSPHRPFASWRRRYSAGRSAASL